MIQYTKILLTVLALGLLVTSCNTTKIAMTKPVEKPAMAENDDVAMKKYINTIDADQVSERLHVFAGYDFEGRRTGTRGQKRAAEYLSNFYHKLGLEGPIKEALKPPPRQTASSQTGTPMAWGARSVCSNLVMSAR